MRTTKVSKYKKLFSTLLNSKGYLGPKIGPVNSSLHFYLIGKRKENCFYDLNKSVVGLKQLFDFLENIIVDRGRVLIVGGSISLVSILLCLSINKDSNLKIVPWDFSRISSSFEQDLFIIQEIDNKAVLESYGHLVPASGANYPDIRGLSYPMNIDLERKELCNWYSWALVASSRRGYYRRFRFYYEV